MSARIGVDVGGTFIDVVCFDEKSGRLDLLKTPSDPNRLAQAVTEGVRKIFAKDGVDPSAVRLFIHGTTVATNAILERKGARMALLVTEGFRDILQIMRQDRPRLYDYFVQRPDPLVPRSLCLEVPERVLYTGEVHQPLRKKALQELLGKIREEQISDIAVCLLHSYVNPRHEEQIRDWVEKEMPHARVSISSEILREFKEFERMNTTVVNAYIRPNVENYLADLAAELHDLGIPSPLHIMQSNGGIMTGDRARRESVRTVLSGPAAGALSGLTLARQAGVKNMISIDMGGTSADVALAYEKNLFYSEESEIGGQIIKIPAIDIHTVGAGGGSIAWIDPGKALQVGPHSAGADPGPACYGRGGQQATVTDANLVLGRLNPDYFLGGEMEVDLERARAVIQEKVARPLGLTLEQAAEGIIRVVNAVMEKGIRRVSVEKGYDPREFTLISFGGGGPLHAAELASELQIPRLLVPPAPGVSSSLGLLTADFRHDYVRTVRWKTNQTTSHELQRILSELKEEAVVQMTAENVDPSTLIYRPSADLCYRGQGYTLEVRFSLEEIQTGSTFQTVEKRFHQMHQFFYGYSAEETATEIVNVRQIVISKLRNPQFHQESEGAEDASAALKGTRRVFLEGRFQDANLYERSLLHHGNGISGPAVVEQSDSTTLVLPGQRARVDAFGNLILFWREP